MDKSIDVGNYRELIINSKDRNSGTNENFFITIDNAVLPANIKNIKLIESYMPYSWYTITSDDDTIVLVESGTPITITIPHQYYDANTLGAIIASELTSNSTISSMYTVAFNNATQRYTINSTAAFSLNFTGAHTTYRYLGFDAAIYNSSSNKITSVNMVSFVDDRYVFIHSNLVNGIDNGVQLITGQTASQLNIMAAVPVTSTFGTLMYYNHTLQGRFIDTTNSPYNQMNNTSLQFWLTLSSGKTIDLNGQYWTIKVMIEY